MDEDTDEKQPEDEIKVAKQQIIDYVKKNRNHAKYLLEIARAQLTSEQNELDGMAIKICDEFDVKRLKDLIRELENEVSFSDKYKNMWYLLFFVMAGVVGFYVGKNHRRLYL